MRTLSLIAYFYFTLALTFGNNGYGNHREIREVNMHQSPQHIYKVISFKNWQLTQKRHSVHLGSEDSAFIHFSTEDQLERIVNKYWAQEPQFVILKILTSKLEGRLLFERNPGGSAYYYHLYNGLIPMDSILEARIIYQQPIDRSEKEEVEIVQIGHPVLRQPARELSIEEITSPEIQHLIEVMKATMRAAPGVGLAAPQIGYPFQLAVIEDIDHGHLSAKQLAERGRHPVPFHVIINPRIYIEEGTNQIDFFEGCLSVPELLGIVPRAESVRVECLNERGEPVLIQAKGWYARILQHEIDHLNSTLYIDRAQLPTLMTPENYAKFHQNKSIREIQADLMLRSQLLN